MLSLSYHSAPGNPIFRRKSAGAGVLTVYFDSDAAPGGDGSQATPYNDLSFFSSLSGDRGGAIYSLKRNSVFLETLSIPDGVSNYTINAYGSGQAPVVANWVQFTATWTSEGGGKYSCPDSSVIAADVPISYSTSLYHTKVDRLGARRLSLADLDLIYEHSTRTLYGSNDIAEFLSFYDSAANKFYVNSQIAMVGVNPKYFYADPGVDYTGEIGTGSNVLIEDIWFFGGYESSLFIRHIDNLTLRRVRAAAPSGPASATTAIAAVISGTSEASKMTGLLIEDCEFGDSLDYLGHGLSLSFIDSPVIRKNWFHDIAEAAVQLAESCENVKIEKNRFDAVNWFLETRTISGTTHHQGILFQNNIVNQRFSYTYPGGVGAGTPSGYGYKYVAGEGKNFSDLRIVNNSFLMEDATVLLAQITGAHALGNASLRFRNNLVIMRQTEAMLNSQREPAIQMGNLTALQECLLDYNVYQFKADHPMFNLLGSTATSEAAYQALWAATSSPTDVNEQNSIVVPAATPTIRNDDYIRYTNFYPDSGSAPQVGTADSTDPDFPTDDYYGFPRSSDTVGAVEYISSGFYATLTGTTDSGRSTVGGSWNPTGSQDAWDNDNDGGGRSTGDYLIGFSFPNVTVTGPITKARFEFLIVTQHVPGEFLVFAQSQDAAPSAAWSATNKPEFATKVSSYHRISNELGRIELDVTDMINEILAGNFWVSGNRINFWVEASSIGADVTSANEANKATILAISI